jgi:hypothetical protein
MGKTPGVTWGALALLCKDLNDVAHGGLDNVARFFATLAKHEVDSIELHEVAPLDVDHLHADR